MIPYGRQEITQADIDAVVGVLKTDFLTQGPFVPKFERCVAEYCGAKHAVATNSATSALHIACLALGLGDGDWLWTSPISFVASSNCGLYCGAQIDFIDIDPKTYNLSPQSLELKLIQAEKKKRLPKIVIVVHLCGQSCDMESIQKLSREYGFSIIEDASHAIGGKYLGKAIGKGQFSDITIFSFHPVKIITTGEGGMAVSNNKQLADKMSLLRSHGITRDSQFMRRKSNKPWYYEQIDLGFNYRMTDIQAALGISQIARLDQYIKRRHDIVLKYDKAFNSFPITLPYQHPDSYSSFHLYVIRLKSNATIPHQQLFEQLRTNGVNVNLHYIPIYTQPYYQDMGFKSSDYPNAEQYYKEALSLPIFPTLSGKEQNQVIKIVQDALTQ
ncbi:Bacillosamine/Legionaminic acid biosynthesis aminotransferase PglE; 4-keto-6-deoxy-N-Acetyl-D-hexosaminyl-(Lipid carrier) aminotransferase [hydrothermal vent metagenome]|uniref:Bacillosamine/Legionaminic acid biosynthesis aminotransferase PglE 4-keto-6-deoxy-N-Acetyl-D-hexosaminyl-(Lipid carrier) aminotransferase n=1 Tax=hydrothermal vent metagenome TaxID=652676 RepID=A0A3B0YR79_9ZZZZ